jgi:hypothetical protein
MLGYSQGTVEQDRRLARVEPAQGATLMRSSSVQLKALARSGGFAVDEDTGNRMIEALQAAMDALERRWPDLEKFQHAPPMSDSPAARWVAKHMVDTATDADGLLTQLRAARNEFPAYVEAIQLAKRAYREQETGVRRELRVTHRLLERGEE